jgi:putative membrane protein
MRRTHPQNAIRHRSSVYLVDRGSPRVPIAGASHRAALGSFRRALFLTSGQHFEQTARCTVRRVYRFCQVLLPRIVALNAIGDAVVGTIGIEPASGQQLVQSGDEPRSAVDQDSRARTHLANERTFLAWLRTGLSLTAVGLAAAGFLPVDLIPGFPYVRSFASLLVLAGTMMVLYGARRYVRAHQQIETGSYDPSGTAIVTIAAIIGLLGIMAIPLVLLLR